MLLPTLTWLAVPHTAASLCNQRKRQLVAGTHLRSSRPHVGWWLALYKTGAAANPLAVGSHARALRTFVPALCQACHCPLPAVTAPSGATALHPQAGCCKTTWAEERQSITNNRIV